MAADIRINLLPWREQWREAQKRRFLHVTAAVLVGAAAIVGGVDRFYNRAIDAQAARNDFLAEEITLLEEKIQAIGQLREQRHELLSRIQAIRELQGNRPVIVRVFDELARQLAPGVFFTSLEMTGASLAIEGVAESNDRISSQLRNFSESAWFDAPNVTAINADTAYGPQASRFELTVAQTTPGSEE